MSKLETVETLAGQFADLNQLLEYTDAQSKLIENLKHECKRLNGEVAKLKEAFLSSKSLSEIPRSKIVVSPEQIICETQIQLLQGVSLSRAMTLEETKRLEILVKSLYLIKERTSGSTEDDLANLPVSSLERLAALPEPEQET
jgi:hypothetical protein